MLPTIELRPVNFGRFSPICQHELRREREQLRRKIRNTRISPSNTFAWRLGWGADYMITKQFALNTEMAYKRNDGHATVNGVTKQRLERLIVWLLVRREDVFLID